MGAETREIWREGKDDKSRSGKARIRPSRLNGKVEDGEEASMFAPLLRAQLPVAKNRGDGKLLLWYMQLLSVLFFSIYPDVRGAGGVLWMNSKRRKEAFCLLQDLVRLAVAIYGPVGSW